jgi:hypothetical protein
MKRTRVWVLVASFVLALTAGCSRSDETGIALPTDVPQPPASPAPTATPDSEAHDAAPVCPPARGDGTISPAISIYSITFVVNGLDQEVRPGDALQALPGDELEVREITLCTGAFSRDGGEVCVDFAPGDPSGGEITSEHAGTHMVRVSPGFMTMAGPSHTWTVGEDWGHIAAVVNHWPPEDTEDVSCGNRRCEHDDRIIIELR